VGQQRRGRGRRVRRRMRGSCFSPQPPFTAPIPGPKRVALGAGKV